VTHSSALDWSTEFRDGQWSQVVAGYKDLLGDGGLELVQFIPSMYELRPDTVKRYRLWVRTVTGGVGLGSQKYPFPKLSWVMMGLFSAAYRYREGLISDLLEARKWGARRAEFVDMLAMCWPHAGQAGMNYSVKVLDDYLRDWAERDDGPGIEWPEGWTPDPSAFRSGIDFSGPDELSAVDLAKLEAWHDRVEGAVPAYVRFFGKHYSLALKVWRARYETSLDGSLPPQMITLSHVYLAAAWAKPDALRRALHAARYFGVDKDFVIQTLALSQQYLGDIAMDAALQGAIEAVDAWEAVEQR
jgi:hypothetical protein